MAVLRVRAPTPAKRGAAERGTKDRARFPPWRPQKASATGVRSGVSLSRRARRRAEPAQQIYARWAPPRPADPPEPIVITDATPLIRRNPAPDVPCSTMERTDQAASVPMPLRLGSQAEDDQARGLQSAQSRDEQNEPPWMRICDRTHGAFRCRGHVQVDQAAEDVRDHPVERHQERDCAQTGDQPNERAANDHAPRTRSRPAGRQLLQESTKDCGSLVRRDRF